MDAPKGSCALLGEGRAKLWLDQKLQIKAASLSGTGKRCASFLNFSRSSHKRRSGSKTKVSGKSKEDPQPTHGDMRSAGIFLISLALMVQGMMSVARLVSVKLCQNYERRVMFDFGP